MLLMLTANGSDPVSATNPIICWELTLETK